MCHLEDDLDNDLFLCSDYEFVVQRSGTFFLVQNREKPQ